MLEETKTLEIESENSPQNKLDFQSSDPDWSDPDDL